MYDIGQHAPLCIFSTIARGYNGSLPTYKRPGEETLPRVTLDDKTKGFLASINPDGAHIGAYFVDEANRDDVTAEHFTFHKALLNTAVPPRYETITELQRFRRWYERALGRRHTSTGRRFRGVHRRQTYHTHGESYCVYNATAGDTVTATIRATSVDHSHVFFEAMEPREYIVGEAVVGLPPWLHSLFDGACAPSRREVYSPPSEGFAAELVEVNVTALAKLAPKTPEATFYSGENVPFTIDSLGDDSAVVSDNDDL
jgi:hypothetical protein